MITNNPNTSKECNISFGSIDDKEDKNVIFKSNRSDNMLDKDSKDQITRSLQIVKETNSRMNIELNGGSDESPLISSKYEEERGDFLETSLSGEDLGMMTNIL